jgi:hypothetical protein
MFLSTRWGKPSYEIESLPLSELNKQMAFWEHHPWGITDDVLALQHSFYVRTKIDKAPSAIEVKRMAYATGAVKAVVEETTKTIRAGIMSIAKHLSKKKVNKK